jgi:signal transduction histidine kinase
MWALGRWVRRSRRQIDDLEERRRRAADEAVVKERRLIAREIHDIVSHSVSVMILQAAGARRVLGTDPERAAVALANIEESGKESMGELRRLLGVLTAGTPPDEVTGPATVAPHGLADLPLLVGRMNESGLQVVLDVTGRSRRLDASVDLSAYRIVQESLTNCLKHAGEGCRVDVQVLWAPSAVVLQVTDDGGLPSPDPRLSIGQGLAGLRERCRAVGGQFESGARPEGGFRVRAVLPVRGSADA